VRGALMLLLVGGALLALGAFAAAQEEEGGGSVTPPLDVEILSPVDGAAFRTPNLTVLVEADGATAGNFLTAFENGTLVNTTADAQGLRANASGATNESYYISQAFELPGIGTGFVWTDPIDFLTSGYAGNLSDLLVLDVRFGDRTPGRNWTPGSTAALPANSTGPMAPSTSHGSSCRPCSTGSGSSTLKTSPT